MAVAHSRRRRLASVLSHLQSAAGSLTASSEPVLDLASHSHVVDFLAELVRAQTDVRSGEPCPGESAVQELISAKLDALGCEVQDMRYEPAALALKDEYADASVVTAGERVSVIGHLRGKQAATTLLYPPPVGSLLTNKDAAQVWKVPVGA